MCKNILNYVRLKLQAKKDKLGSLKSREHEKNTLRTTLILLARDPLLESCWTRKGVGLFEELYTDRMAGGARNALKHNNPEAVRRAAIVLLGEIGDPAARASLFHIVRGTDEKGRIVEKNEVRLEAIRALGKIGSRLKGEDRILRFLMAVAREYKELNGPVLNKAIADANTGAL
jgi:HEAT repeat protein